MIMLAYLLTLDPALFFFHSLSHLWDLCQKAFYTFPTSITILISLLIKINLSRTFKSVGSFATVLREQPLGIFLYLFICS